MPAVIGRLSSIVVDVVHADKVYKWLRHCDIQLLDSYMDNMLWNALGKLKETSFT